MIASMIVGGGFIQSIQAAKIDAAFLNLNSFQAKTLGSKYKDQVDRLPGHGLDVALPALKVALDDATATGLRELLKAKAANNLDDYIAAAKVALKAAVNAWINTLLADNNNFIVAGVARQDNGGGGTTPANQTRDAFKAALDGVIDGQTRGTLHGINNHVGVPADLKLNTLMEIEAHVKRAFSIAIERWINTLLGANHQFLDGGVTIAAAVGGVGHGAAMFVRGGPPIDRNRDSFKAALTAVIIDAHF